MISSSIGPEGIDRVFVINQKNHPFPRPVEDFNVDHTDLGVEVHHPILFDLAHLGLNNPV